MWYTNLQLLHRHQIARTFSSFFSFSFFHSPERIKSTIKFNGLWVQCSHALSTEIATLEKRRKIKKRLCNNCEGHLLHCGTFARLKTVRLFIVSDGKKGIAGSSLLNCYAYGDSHGSPFCWWENLRRPFAFYVNCLFSGRNRHRNSLNTTFYAQPPSLNKQILAFFFVLLCINNSRMFFISSCLSENSHSEGKRRRSSESIIHFQMCVRETFSVLRFKGMCLIIQHDNFTLFAHFLSSLRLGQRPLREGQRDSCCTIIKYRINKITRRWENVYLKILDTIVYL